jgi:hypothetical protein
VFPFPILVSLLRIRPLGYTVLLILLVPDDLCFMLELSLKLQAFELEPSKLVDRVFPETTSTLSGRTSALSVFLRFGVGRRAFAFDIERW